MGEGKSVWPTSRGEGDPSVFKVGNPKTWPVFSEVFLTKNGIF